MPELPDVEGFRRVAQEAAGARISGVEVRDWGVLRNTSSRALDQALAGQRVAAADRRGKWLVLSTSGPSVVLHFGMTGSLHWQPEPDGYQRHDRVALATTRGWLVYRDQRKLRGLWLAHDDAEVDRIVGALGPDAFGITAARLDRALAGRRRGLKSSLMDQAVVAGLGNLTTDEILWRARLHPQARYDDLDPGERKRLHQAIGAVLRPAVRTGFVPGRRGWLTSRRDEPEPVCPRCGRRLKKMRVGGRTSVFCPSCQPARARR